MAVHIDQIVPWGRAYNEYRLMFSLSAQNLSSGVLDCGGGPASFTGIRGRRLQWPKPPLTRTRLETASFTTRAKSRVTEPR